MATTCRLCASSISNHCYLSIFTYLSIQKSLPSRIQQLLNVEVTVNDNLPCHICNVCMKRLEYLEKAKSDLVLFEKQAKDV